MHVHAEALDAVRERLVALLEAEGEVTLGRLRDELGTSRKYAQALLERFDAERLTLRRGDARVLRRRRASVVTRIAWAVGGAGPRLPAPASGHVPPACFRMP